MSDCKSLMLLKAVVSSRGPAGGWEGDTQCSPQPPTCASRFLSSTEIGNTFCMLNRDGPIDWLEQETLYPKVYWKSQAREFAAAGAVRTFESVPEHDGLIFGGEAFSSDGKEGVWKNVPRSFYFQPQKICFGKERASVVCNPRACTRIDTPCFSHWEKQVMRTLERIKASEIQKIVHARETTIRFDEAISAFDLLRKLAQRQKSETLFFLQWNPETTFLGLTPEKLYARKGREIFSHAVAGTRPAGLGKELLNSMKDRNEFEHVKEFLAAKLQEICTHVACSRTHLIQAGNLEHLTCNFSGTLHDPVSDQQIISSLHPTPAVCGLPQTKSLQILAKEEPFDRGSQRSGGR